VDPRNPILQLKEALQDLEGVPAAQQKIFFAGKPLANGRSLLDYRYFIPVFPVVPISPLYYFTSSSSTGKTRCIYFVSVLPACRKGRRWT
jgi:hypothetical protein